MKLPTLAECQRLFEQYKIPSTVRQHCQTVYRVATVLADQLIATGYPLRKEVVGPLALLHDFMKAVVIERLGGDPFYQYTPTAEEVAMHQELRQKYAGLSETYVTYLLLKDQYPEFAQLFLELDQFTRNPQTPVQEETKFIHYVDWRVLGNKVVPLKKRMDYIYERYGLWIEKKNIDWEEAKNEQFEYEHKIFNCLPFTAEELGEKWMEKR